MVTYTINVEADFIQFYMRIVRKNLAIKLSITLIAMLQCSCGNISYYSQSISGHLSILNNQESISKILAQPDIDDTLRQKLTMVIQIRDFASQELDLPDNGSYRKYSELDREHVVWNIVATPEFSLRPIEWCFLLVGCLPYRGYFKKNAAMEFAQSLKDEGYDVFIGGVTAYSTLGWFDDPVLNTMLKKDTIDLARVIFHELAHQKTYVKDDTEFNEAFADTVAIIGIQRWLNNHMTETDPDEIQAELKRENDFVELVEIYKARLNELYSTDLSVTKMRARKQSMLEEMVTDYNSMKTHWNGADDYAAWFNTNLNNAKLTSVLTYRDLVPTLMELYENNGSNLELFYRQIGALAQCNSKERKQILEHNLPVNCLK